jgi:carbon storage regulator
MLVLSVKEGEYIKIGDNITVRAWHNGTAMRIAVDAPKELLILRGELLERSEEQHEKTALGGRVAKKVAVPTEAARSKPTKVLTAPNRASSGTAKATK